jgi:hypothetical protein
MRELYFANISLYLWPSMKRFSDFPGITLGVAMRSTKHLSFQG